jgi:DNA-binding MarR family transcriptional regulator
MMTSKLVQTLEQRGYLARHGDRADARLRRLELTSLGRAAVHAAVQAAQAVDGELFEATGPGFRDALRAIAEQTWETVGDH